MRKTFKLLAALLCMVLVLGTIPVQAASTAPSLKKSSKILYLGGCTGSKANGKKASYYSFLKVKKVLKNFDSKTMDLKLESGDKDVCTVSNKTYKVFAKGRGTATVTVTVREKATEKVIMAKEIKITVKKNAADDFKITGIEDGKEYKVGDVITVKMPRTEDDDYRRLTCSDDDAVSFKKTGTYGSAYKITFKKAGTFTINAEAYQTNTYKGTTASQSFEVTVTGDPEPTAEPTATPTSAPTPTPSATPTAAPSDFSVKQTALDTIVISGIANPDSIKASDLEIYSMITNVKIPRSSSSIQSVTSDGKDVTVKMLSIFDKDTVFYVNYAGNKGEAASFKAVSYSEKDIESIGITNTKVIINENVDLGIRYFNKDGIDITAGVSGLVIPSLEQVQGDIGVSYASGSSTVYFLVANKTSVFEITVYKGANEIGTPLYVKQKVAVTSYEPQASGLLYTVKAENGVYMKATDTNLTDSFTLDTTTPVIEVLFVYKDEAGKTTYKTLDEEGIDRLQPADEKILFIGTKSPTGGWTLIPNNTGSTNILLYKGDKVVGVAPVTVLAAKTATGLTVTASKQTLNVNPMANDYIEVTATIKDQYGNEMKGQPLSIEQTDGTKTVTGVVSFGTFDTNGKLVIKGTDVVLNSGKKNGVIIATVKSGNSSYNIQFQVADFSEATVWTLSSNPEASLLQMDTAIKAGDANPSEVKMSIQGRNGAFTVKNELLRFYPGKAPSAQIKATDLGVSVGDTVYLYTIQKDGKYVDVLPDLVTDTSYELIFKSFDYQKQLASGQYIVAAYKLTAGLNNSSISQIGQRTIIVTNNQPAITYKQIKETTTYSVDIDIVKDCFEFYLEGKKLDPSSIIAADVSVSGTGSKLVKSVKISYSNSVYGIFTKDVTITNSSIIK